MPRRWTKEEEDQKREELQELYVEQNMSIGEIAPILGISECGVWNRLIRLGIPVNRSAKARANNKKVIHRPPLSAQLAEFVGIMLGDGHLGKMQLAITINTITDIDYIPFVVDLIKDLFHLKASFTHADTSSVDVIVSSVDLIKYLNEIGLTASNKVQEQADVPSWILERVLKVLIVPQIWAMAPQNEHLRLFCGYKSPQMAADRPLTSDNPPHRILLKHPLKRPQVHGRLREGILRH